MSSLAGRLAKNAALALCSLAVAFALAEATARLVFGDRTVLYPRYHTARSYGRYSIRSIRPHTRFHHTSVDGSWEFVTNGRGFRNRAEIDYAKPSGTFRVLCLGDSHTQGYEVRQESTFSATLERYLAQRGLRAEVINAGVSGFSTAEELVFLENEGVKYAPDAVVLGFFANDYEDNLKAGLFGLDAQGRLTEEKTVHLPGVSIQEAIYRVPGVKWLGENSYFYSLLFNGVWSYFKARLGRAAADRDAMVGGDGRSQRPASFEYAVPGASAVTPRQAALAMALLERMDTFCKARRMRLIVVDIPTHLGPYRFASSFLPPLLERMNATATEHVDSRLALGAYQGMAEIHVPHGHHHISEFTHTVLGGAIGRRLLGEDEGSRLVSSRRAGPAND